MAGTTEVVRCPQCQNVAVKSKTAITDEHSIECRYCGYQQIKTINGTDTFKGYGSLVVNDTAVLFHEPILFEKEQDILKSISENPNASFFKWTDEYGITVLKGELPEEWLEDEIQDFISEQEYYKQCESKINGFDYY